MQTLQYVTNEIIKSYNVDLENVKDVFESIIEEEREHREALVTVMKLLKEKTEDEGFEKHVPIVQKTEAGVNVKVGSIQHPMEENHYIEWIEVIEGDRVIRKHLKPGEVPDVTFNIDTADIIAREYCTVHGLWRN